MFKSTATGDKRAQFRRQRPGLTADTSRGAFDLIHGNEGEQETLVRLAVEAGQLGVWRYDFAGKLLTGNDAFWAMFGLLGGAGRSPVALRAAVHLEDTEALTSMFSPPRLQKRKDVGGEFRVLRPDRGLRWIDMRGSFDPASGMLLGVTVEITERREAESLKARLAQQPFAAADFTHRMKNLFPVIHAIVKLMAGYHGSVAGFQRALTSRLRALEATHGLLTRDPNGGASIEEIVRMELAALKGSGRVNLAGRPIQLAGGIAENFSMIVHELATNSIKYGALGQQRGRLDVCWGSMGSASEEQLVFEWKESGCAAPKRDRRRGYGSFVLGANGPPIVGERAELMFTDDGVSYTVVLPHAGVRSSLPRRFGV